MTESCLSVDVLSRVASRVRSFQPSRLRAFKPRRAFALLNRLPAERASNHGGRAGDCAMPCHRPFAFEPECPNLWFERVLLPSFVASPSLAGWHIGLATLTDTTSATCSIVAPHAPQLAQSYRLCYRLMRSIFFGGRAGDCAMPEREREREKHTQTHTDTHTTHTGTNTHTHTHRPPNADTPHRSQTHTFACTPHGPLRVCRCVVCVRMCVCEGHAFANRLIFFVIAG